MWTIITWEWLFIKVYENSSSQSPAMNFDRSAVSLRINITWQNKQDVEPKKIKRDIRGGEFLAARGIIWTNLVEVHKMMLQT